MGGDNTGGLYRWTMDALFNRGVSPSNKYKNNRDDTFFDETDPRQRPSSSSEIDIYSKYDLLPDEDEPELLRPVSVNGVFDDKQDTNTFQSRRHRNVEGTPSIRKSPSLEDPVISRLFQLHEEPITSKKAALPGKFPSPSKSTKLDNKDFVSDPYRSEEHMQFREEKVLDYTPEYVSLMDKLSLNNRALQSLKNEVYTRQKKGINKETELQQRYIQIRQELIQELKQSKLIYDNYCTLYYRYKDLKKSIPSATARSRNSNPPDSTSLLLKIKSLESQIVDMSIENGKLKKEADERVLSIELQKQDLQNKFEIERMIYERKIEDLEQKLSSRPPERSSTGSSFLPRTQDTSESTASPYKDYNNTIDTQFLRNLVK